MWLFPPSSEDDGAVHEGGHTPEPRGGHLKLFLPFKEFSAESQGNQMESEGNRSNNFAQGCILEWQTMLLKGVFIFFGRKIHFPFVALSTPIQDT